LEALAAYLGGKKVPAAIRKMFDSYVGLSASKTTDASRRAERDKLFVGLVEAP
jgi:hypothetical protein